MSHTSGPWEVAVDINPLYKGVIAILEHNPERLLAVVSHYGDLRHDHDANARLIAAAPDLLEAAEHAHETMLLHYRVYKMTVPDVVDELADAIAKAKGTA